MSERLTFDLSANEASTGDPYSPLPEGSYDVIIDDVTDKPAKSGKAMYTLTYKVEGGDQDGKTHRDYSVLSSGALFTQVSIQKALEMDDTFTRDAEGKITNIEIASPDELIGKRLNITIRHKDGEYNGEKVVNANVSSRRPIKAGATKKATAKKSSSNFAL